MLVQQSQTLGGHDGEMKNDQNCQVIGKTVHQFEMVNVRARNGTS